MAMNEATIDLIEAELAKRFLPNLSGASVSWLALVEQMAREEGVFRRLVNSLSSRASATRARHRAWAVLREARYSLTEIAEPWGVHHTSVRAAVIKLAAKRQEAA